MTSDASLLLLHAAATCALVGLIWTIQIVHYPLLDGVGADDFDAYHRRHTTAITWVVGPLMLTELGAAVLLLSAAPAGVAPALLWSGLALVALLWAITAFVSVPLHQRLGSGFEAAVHRRLVQTNWFRTAGWTVRGALALAMLLQYGQNLLRPPVASGGP